jgi:hypothetical protein
MERRQMRSRTVDRFGQEVEPDAEIIQFKRPMRSQVVNVADRATARQHLAECRAILTIVEPTIVPVAAVEQLPLSLSVSTIADAPTKEI